MAEKTDDLIGTTLDDYEIVRLLGKGGMARVYEARDVKLHRPVALKVMSEQYFDDPEVTQRFFREARAVANLDHPNIIAVYRFGEGSNRYYLAMKLIEGKTLLSVLKKLRQQRKYLEPERVVRIMSDIASALDYAHSRGLVHRDIKPSNIMLTNAGPAVLMDFGLLMQEGAETTLGTAFGTPRYIAPEQAIASHRAVPQSDIYALGVVLYEMVTGQTPFDADSAVSLALSHINNPPPAPRTVRPDLPEAVELVILKALEKAPANRWRTAYEMAQALRQAYAGITPKVQIMAAPEVITEPAVPAVVSPVVSDPAPETFVSTPMPVAPTRRNGRFLAVLGAMLVGLVVLGALSIAAETRAAQLGLPTATPKPAPIRLIYGSSGFTIYNASEQVISLEGLWFARPDLMARFNVLLFGDQAHKALQPGQCLVIQLRDEPNIVPKACTRVSSAYTLNSRSLFFWAQRDPGRFLVQMGNTTVHTCFADLNTCEFALP